VVDPGLQNERTELAWHRTALALLTASLLLFRLTVERLGPVAVLSVLVAVPLTFWVLVRSRLRYRWHHAAAAYAPTRDGRSVVSLTVAIVTMTATELVGILGGAS
jgi:uncharacterized membrane protein YidH (DUF202 family)